MTSTPLPPGVAVADGDVLGRRSAVTTSFDSRNSVTANGWSPVTMKEASMDVGAPGGGAGE